MTVSTTTSATASDAVARARELIPELRERAAQTALDRRLPVANIEALRRAGALKTIQARRNGGYALGIRSHLDVMSALGRGCGSTAWTLRLRRPVPSDAAGLAKRPVRTDESGSTQLIHVGGSSECVQAESLQEPLTLWQECRTAM